MKHYVAIPTVSALGINPHVKLLERLRSWRVWPDFVDGFMPQWVARREIARRFLASSADHLTMIDCDTVPEFNYGNDIGSEPDIVAGHYALYTDGAMFQWSVGKLIHKGAIDGSHVYQFAAEIPDGWSSWDACGFGYVTIPRKTLEAVAITGVFDKPPLPGHTEDTPVCLQARNMGYDIVTHPTLRCSHYRAVNISAQLDVQTELINRINKEKP